MKKRIQTVACIGMAFLLSACSDSDVSRQLAAPSSPAVEPVGQSVALVDALGGSLFGPSVSFHVPAGAVLGATQISMDTYMEAGAPVVELGPDGQQFALGCRLSFELPPGTPPWEQHVVQWWDPAAQEWVDIGGRRAGDTVVAVLQHFSKYRVVEEFH